MLATSEADWNLQRQKSQLAVELAMREVDELNVALADAYQKVEELAASGGDPETPMKSSKLVNGLERSPHRPSSAANAAVVLAMHHVQQVVRDI